YHNVLSTGCHLLPYSIHQEGYPPVFPKDVLAGLRKLQVHPPPLRLSLQYDYDNSPLHTTNFRTEKTLSHWDSPSSLPTHPVDHWLSHKKRGPHGVSNP